MDKPIYFSKIEFKNNFIKDCEGTMLLNLVEKELSYQLVRRYQKDERILFSYGVKIKDDDLPELLQYCNAFDFELIETLMNLWSSRGVVDTETVGE